MIRFESFENKREKLVQSLREKFNKAIAVGAMTATFAGAFSSFDYVGFDKKEVFKMLNSPTEISVYLNNAGLVAREGDILEEKERDILIKMSDEGNVLKKNFGEEFLNYMILPFEDIDEDENRSAKEIMENNNGEFEKIGISPDVVEKVLNSLPKSWIENIKSIKCVDNISKGDERYGIKDAIEMANSFFDAESGTTEITFFKTRKGWSDNQVIITLVHEIAHANDWTNYNNSIPERVHMLYEILQRMAENGSFNSWYLESIENKNPKLKLKLKAEEYWAEINEQYYKDADKLPVADRNLVGKYRK